MGPQNIPDGIQPPDSGWRFARLSPSLPEVFASVRIDPNWGFWRKMLAFTGPGLLIAVGYMDPGNWATDIAGGAQFATSCCPSFCSPTLWQWCSNTFRSSWGWRPAVTLHRHAVTTTHDRCHLCCGFCVRSRLPRVTLPRLLVRQLRSICSSAFHSSWVC